ncbi:MAG: HAD family hydrolase [candidate division WOR-3 bacterium]
MRGYLILDLDGTILDDNKNVYREFLEVLPRIRRKYRIIIASGRAKFSVEKYLKEMDLPEFYVSFEGAYIVWDGKIILRKPFTDDYQKYIESNFGNFALVKFYENGVKPNDRFFKEFSHYLKRWGAEMFGEGSDVFKYVIATRSKDIIGDLPGTVFVYKRRDDIFYDIAPDTTKAEGLKILMEKFDILPQECVAFGDYYNDIGIFKLCGFSVAVPRAPEDVKSFADMVAQPWDPKVLEILGV